MSGGSSTSMPTQRIGMGPLGSSPREPAPAPASRRNSLTRLGFLCGFPMIFLSLATNLWATRGALPSVSGREHAIFFILFVLPAFFGGIVTHRQAARPRLIPALLAGGAP